MRRCLSLLAVASLLTISACDEPFSARAEREIIVLGYRAPCTGFLGEPVPCFRAVIGSGDTTAFLDDAIEGFTFEPGVRQRLLIEWLTIANPPADGSSLEFRLIRVISRKRVSIVLIVPELLRGKTVD